ncbi:MAG: energy-coupling factor transporter ATPase [Oscillospiraceae bacterium]|jgi:energy-coupling factor transport system ATP-binding protein|nr:energy-coupling factor transporter ATPase [Oscillospiraceae bacterium]
MANVNKAIITAVKLTHTYASPDNSGDESVGTQALRGVDLEIAKGEFVAVLGHNGSGKSTLARHFNALLKPDSGTVFVENFNTADDDSTIEIRRRVGMVFQNPDNQIVANVVEEDVAFAPENLGIPPAEIRKRVDDALRTVGMYEYREHAPHLLSGGQKQRVAIAGALAMQPECIVFDEPTAMLDPQGREDVVAIIRALRDELGVTVILITHHMEEAINCDRIFIMNEGEVVKVGTPQEIFREVKLLRELGLDVPDTVELLYDLNQAGFNLPLDALTEDEAAAAIALNLGVSR